MNSRSGPFNQWVDVRLVWLWLPVALVLLVLDYAFAGQNWLMTRVLGEGANAVDVSQFFVAPLATVTYLIMTSGHSQRERSSYGRAQRWNLPIWLLISLAAGVGPLVVGYGIDASSLRVAGLSFLGLAGLASSIGYLSVPPVGTAMPIGFFVTSLLIANQRGGPSDLLWPLVLDINWSYGWTAVAFWAVGTVTVRMRPTLRHCAHM